MPQDEDDIQLEDLLKKEEPAEKPDAEEDAEEASEEEPAVEEPEGEASEEEADEEEAVDGADDAAPEGEPSGEQAQEARDLIEWAAKLGHEGVAGRYKNDEAMILGLLETAKKIGVRDQDAELGRMARARPDVIEFLQGKQPQQQAPPPPKQETPTTAAQVEAWQAAVAANPQNPPTEAVAGLQKVSRDAVGFYLQMQDPNFRSQMLQPVLQEQQQALQQQWQQTATQQAAQQQENAQLRDLQEQYKADLFVNGDPATQQFTPAGVRADELFREEQSKGMPKLEAARIALLRLESEQYGQLRAQRTPKPARPGAKRKPNVASPAAPDGAVDMDKMIDGADSVGELLCRAAGIDPKRLHE